MPFAPSCRDDRIVPTVNFYQTKLLRRPTEPSDHNIDISNSAPGATVNVATLQNALNIIHADPAK